MTSSAPVWDCPFNHTDGLEFDPLLKRLLTEAPIARIRLPHGEGEAWLATRYEDVRVVTTDRRFSRAAGIGRDLPRMTPAPIAQAEAINLMDPPAHNRLRRLVAQGFTNRQVERMRPTTQRIVDGYLDEMAEHGSPPTWCTSSPAGSRSPPSASCWTSPSRTAPNCAATPSP